MRTLKFRAWHKPKKKMLYVGNAFMPDLTASGCPVDPYENRRNLSMIFELMQYSGLKDKEGKEIYEGDIMQGSVTSPKYRVTMDCGRWCANYTHKGNSGALQLYFRQDMFEIIGNIYQNPELLSQPVKGEIMDKGLDFVLGKIRQLNDKKEEIGLSKINLESGQAPLTPRERIQELLLDDYSVKLYEMTDEQLEEEYEDRIGDRRLL